MLSYQARLYRLLHKSQFSLEIVYKESDIYLDCSKPLEKNFVKGLVKKYYEEIEKYAKDNPRFLTSLSPLEEDKAAPPIVQEMISASKISGIGPFSSVAGAISWYIGKDLANFCDEIILENGGDLFLKINEDKRVGLYLGEGIIPQMLTIKIKKRGYPFGICSSSSRIGHSLNFGRADLVTVIASNSILADTFATSFSNRVKRAKDVDNLFTEARTYPFIQGLIVVFGGKITMWGDLELDV
jgi:hypothetical protein